VSRVPPYGRTPTSEGSSPTGALGRSGPSDTAKDRSPQDPSVGAARGSEGPAPEMPATVDTTNAGDGSLALEVESEVETMVVAGATSSPKAGEVVGQDPAASSSGPTVSPSYPQPQAADGSTTTGADETIMEELEAVLGHPPLRAPGDVSLDEVIGTVRWVLNQAQDMLRQVSGDIQDERRRHLLWASMLKRSATSKRAMAQVRQQHLNAREDLLNQQVAAINQRNVNSAQMLADAKELYASAEACASAVIKQEEDLAACTCAID
jgi:hypothetical protein